ncbi:MAG: helix-turn-helix transcriptional regulator [Nitrososphaerota archaeon]|jgi:hypothetical protein|nr:helix-turn-helix transcriptional regulator [Nitrososphaerota archaeon]MDG6929783.1 helix-turn-helix transcriptional regulator [Nitrososphaerota archaeon]
MMEKNITINDLIKELHATMSYESMAKIFGVSKVAVYFWANGKRMPGKKNMTRIMPIIEDMLGLSMYVNQVDDHRNHGGPPDNQFTWRKTDPPLLRKALNFMVHYAGMYSITNREMMDTAALYIREIYKEYKVGKTHLPMFALCALKVASLKHLHYIDISDAITDQEIFDIYWSLLSKRLI